MNCTYLAPDGFRGLWSWLKLINKIVNVELLDKNAWVWTVHISTA